MIPRGLDVDAARVMLAASGMRHIRTKLTIAASVAIAAVMSVHAVLRVEREAEAFLGDVERDHQALGHALADTTAAVVRRSGVEAALEAIDEADRRRDHVQIRWRRGRQDPFAGEVVEGETRAFVTRVPLDAGSGAIELRESLAPYDDYLRDSVIRVTVATLLTILACAILIHLAGWLVLDRRLRPLLAAIRRIGDGDLESPIPRDGEDELGVLGRELDEMRADLAALRETASRESDARLAALDQLRHADRLSTVGKLAAGVAHELGTPLNVVGARAKMIHRGESEGDEIADDARVIGEQTERMTRIIRQLLDFARRRPPERGAHDVRGIVESVLAMLRPHGKHVTLTLEDGPEAQASIDPGQLVQVMTNLVMNAIQAQPDDGQVTVRVRPDADFVVIDVEDRGPGLPVEARQRVFEPFYTTKDVGEGTGLGLSVVHGIVEEHGGAIEVLDGTEGGALFRVRVPGAAA